MQREIRKTYNTYVVVYGDLQLYSDSIFDGVTADEICEIAKESGLKDAKTMSLKEYIMCLQEKNKETKENMEKLIELLNDSIKDNKLYLEEMEYMKKDLEKLKI